LCTLERFPPPSSLLLVLLFCFGGWTHPENTTRVGVEEEEEEARPGLPDDVMKTLYANQTFEINFFV
jgi:hypothetical protein